MAEQFDVLVIGCGISGLATVAGAVERGLSVLVITKNDHLTESNTWYAQGGIVETGLGDSPELLEDDIMRAGSYVNNRLAVKTVAEEGPRLVDEYLVQKAGVPFAQAVGGGFDRTREAAHSVRRILHVQDTTGRSIETALLDYVRSFPTVQFRTRMAAIDIITNTHHSTDSQERYKDPQAMGAYVLDIESGQVSPIFASAVVLASGGVGNVYLHTSNPESATGDGVAMAYRAGCEILNAEFVQFHPTVLFHRDVKRFLISEALRGEGARLRNRAGHYFMKDYNPKLLDLAPRDETARAVYREMGSHGGYVLLDATNVPTLDHAARFPGIYEQCQKLGIDIAKEAIPVVPAAHFFCGGVKVNAHSETAIQRLYAVGETSCNGVHGANRLASVSLLEGLVFGIRAGQHIAEQTVGLGALPLSTIPEWQYPKTEREFDPMLLQNDMTSIQTTMWNYVGIIRTPRRLARAISDLNYLSHRIQRFYQEARLNKEIIELRNAILSGIIIAQAAGKNPRSIGCHYLEPSSISDEF